jgi:hypothetical protein
MCLEEGATLGLLEFRRRFSLCNVMIISLLIPTSMSYHYYKIHLDRFKGARLFKGARFYDR